MFERLLPPLLHTRPAFLLLKAQVEEAACKSPPRIRHPSPKAVVDRITLMGDTVDRLLDERQNWLELHPGRRCGLLDEIEDRIWGYVSEAEFLVSALKLSLFARVVAARKIQRTVLRWLYHAEIGGIPPIGRSLLRDGFVGDDDGAFGHIGTGDSDGSD